jgi:hypothetical protein
VAAPRVSWPVRLRKGPWWSKFVGDFEKFFFFGSFNYFSFDRSNVEAVVCVI